MHGHLNLAITVRGDFFVFISNPYNYLDQVNDRGVGFSHAFTSNTLNGGGHSGNPRGHGSD